MRILHLLKHAQHGHGNAHVAIDLACVQSQKGHSVIYASAGGDYDALLDAQNVRRESIHQSGNAMLLGRNLARLIGLCRSFKPDVIHAHMMSSAVFAYCASRITGVPVVTTVHNSFDRHSIFMRLGCIVVAVSEAERKFLLTRGFTASRVVVVLNGPNGSPRETFKPATAVTLATPSVTTVCGLHYRKGVHDLLAAFRHNQAEFPDWHLNIIGDGPDRTKLEFLAQELGLAQSVHFLGSIDMPKPLLQRSDIFVLASYADPCSLAVAEAREAGCAIVATAVGGTPELLAHGEAGLLVQPGDPEQLAAALRQLMREESIRRIWQTKAKTGAEYFNINRAVQDYENVYEMVRHV